MGGVERVPWSGGSYEGGKEEGEMKFSFVMYVLFLLRPMISIGLLTLKPYHNP